MASKYVRLIAAALMTIMLVAATGQSSTQMMSMQDLVDNVGAGVFKWSGAAQAGSATMVNESTFAADILNNGSCLGSGNRLISYSEATACRVLTTTVAALNDPWLTSTSTYWTQSGGSFIGCSSCNAGPAGEYYFASTSGSNNTGTIKQVIAPATIQSGTTIVARAYLSYTSYSELGDNANCGDPQTTFTGSASLQIQNSGGGVVASVPASGSTMTVRVVSYTVATTGTYYVVASVTSAFSGAYNYNVYTNKGGTLGYQCVLHPSSGGTGYGQVTDLTIGNS
jgi:hypothetical protein